jgi:molybdate transport system substrate-binding protein
MRRWAVVVVLLGTAVASCGDGDDGGGPERSSSELGGTITVSAAASLADAFTELGEDFEAANPGVGVELNFDSSSALADQLLEGARADVFASADEASMTRLSDEDLIAGEPQVFARNQLAIVTQPGNPEGVADLADLADVGVVALCGEDVPCGRYAAEVFDRADVSVPESNVTRGQNAQATLTAVSEGDAVAGIVYVTDAESAGDAVEAVTVPADANAVAVYPIGVLAASDQDPAVHPFVQLVVGDRGQAVLEEHGFLPAS